MLFFLLFIKEHKIANTTQLFHVFCCKLLEIIHHIIFKSYVIEWTQYYYSLSRGFYLGQPPTSHAYNILSLNYLSMDFNLCIFDLLYGKEAWIARLQSGIKGDSIAERKTTKDNCEAYLKNMHARIDLG